MYLVRRQSVNQSAGAGGALGPKAEPLSGCPDKQIKIPNHTKFYIAVPSTDQFSDHNLFRLFTPPFSTSRITPQYSIFRKYIIGDNNISIALCIITYDFVIPVSARFALVPVV
ncbi:hypothetical protein AgCh_013865 [Apium graveolens]